ncbi:hypothetical protein ACGF8B_36750 [Streptomyces sp. NPDC047917]|uniref:hypothetical protein n=1 Tax=Streptomyces sp. NPDC047917 TaxID=3365491 RepID=UPI0037212D46
MPDCNELSKRIDELDGTLQKCLSGEPGGDCANQRMAFEAAVQAYYRAGCMGKHHSGGLKWVQLKDINDGLDLSVRTPDNKIVVVDDFLNPPGIPGLHEGIPAHITTTPKSPGWDVRVISDSDPRYTICFDNEPVIPYVSPRLGVSFHHCGEPDSLMYFHFKDKVILDRPRGTLGVDCVTLHVLNTQLDPDGGYGIRVGPDNIIEYQE